MLFRLPVVVFAGFFVQSVTACAQKTEKEFHDMLDNRFSYGVPLIKVDSLQKLHDVVLLDTREKEEHEVSHIKGAIWVGYDEFQIEKLAGISKDAFIVTYCSVGYRSNKIGEKLKKTGYSNVHNLYGSIFEWVNKGYPVYNSSGEETMQVHTYNFSWSKWLLRGEKVY